MTNPALFVFSNPVEGMESEYNEWYTNTHLPEVLEIPGIVAAQRWKVAEQPGDLPAHRYFAMYELDERSPSDVIGALIAAGPTMSMSPALGGAQMVLYEPITGRVLEVGEAAS